MPYQPFLPPLLPLTQSEDDWGVFGAKLSLAAAKLGRFSGMLENSPKADPFWMVWLLKESQFSTEIEGTIATLDEVLENNAGLPAPVERREDVIEVANYRIAMETKYAPGECPIITCSPRNRECTHRHRS